jgi:hypothetical protein
MTGQVVSGTPDNPAKTRRPNDGETRKSHSVDFEQIRTRLFLPAPGRLECLIEKHSRIKPYQQ